MEALSHEILKAIPCLMERFSRLLSEVGNLMAQGIGPTNGKKLLQKFRLKFFPIVDRPGLSLVPMSGLAHKGEGEHLHEENILILCI